MSIKVASRDRTSQRSMESHFQENSHGCSIRHFVTRIDRRRGPYRLAIVFVLLLHGFLGVRLNAQDRYWNNGTSSLAWYELGFNWVSGVRPSATETANFQLSGNYEVWWDSATVASAPSVGKVVVSSGSNVSFVNTTNDTPLLFTINPNPNTIGMEVASASLRINGLHVHSLFRNKLHPNSDLHLDGNHMAGTRLTVGAVNDIKGQLLVSSGAELLTELSWISGGGVVRIQGNGSHWNGGGMIIGEGDLPGQLEITDGATVSSSYAEISPNYTSQLSTATVSGAGSTWTNSGGIDIGYRGRIDVENGGVVNTADLTLGSIAEGIATASANTNGTLNVTHNLQIGANSGGTGILNINGGTVRVSGGTTIESGSQVNMNGGRFEFGTMSLADMGRISGPSGSLAGTTSHVGYTNVASLTALQNANFDMTDVSLVNSGGLYGNASLRTSLSNMASGEVDTIGNERMRFAGDGTNTGQINIFGGQVRFDGSFLNDVGGEINNFGSSFVADQVTNLYGLISGRGQFVANNGWSNQGVMAFSHGTTDIHGDVYNQEGAQIVTSGNGTTTFYGDFSMENGGELRTSAGSSTVFFGEVSGNGNYTGDGTVFMEGDLRPGNSPGTMSFGGDLVFSSTASTTIELGGLEPCDFDRLLVSGDLFLGNSNLNVHLWDGFELGSNMQFLITEVGGNLFGQFAGLADGALVGNFGGRDLFINYRAGSGGGVSLFTAVPEPSAAVLISLSACSFLFSRKRRLHRCNAGSLI